MKKKKKAEVEIAYDSEIFQRLDQSLKSGLSSNTSRLLAKLAEGLVARKIVSKTGKIAANRESGLAYLEKVLPYMSFRDFAILEADPEGFVRNFVFSPSDRKVSLVTYLQSQDVLDEKFNLYSNLGWKGDSSEIFDEFWEQYEMSPFQLIDKYIAVEFWGDVREWFRGDSPLFLYKKFFNLCCFLQSKKYKNMQAFYAPIVQLDRIALS